jgi:hypothetical protein
MALIDIVFDEPDRTGTLGIEIEGGAIVGALWRDGEQWTWELYDEQSDGKAFATGKTVGINLAKADVQTAAINRIVGTIY